MRLTSGNVGDYLRTRGVVPSGAAVEVRPLSGGISNVVLRADWPGGSVVVKQSLPKLRVEEDWSFDPARILVERDCMETLDELLPGAAPRVVFSDDEALAFGMTTAPDGGTVWKDAKLRGELDGQRAERAGTLLGRMHRRSVGRADLEARFADLMPLEQGRIDPYHRRTATVHPDLAGRIEEEVERLVHDRRALVHGDYSPKNLIAYPDRVLMLDFEVAHWGNPAFDPAFLMTHLILASVHLPEVGDGLLDEAGRFWSAYLEAAGAAAGGEAAVVGQLGCLLLARIDGKSKVEYLAKEADRDAVRRFARELLLSRATAIAPVLSAAADIR